MRTFRLAGFALVAASFFITACEREPALEAPAPPVSPRDAGASADASGLAAPLAAPSDVPEPTCESRIAERVLAAPSARHDAYAQGLPEVIVHAQIDPVLFLRWPDERPRSAEAA